MSTLTQKAGSWQSLLYIRPRLKEIKTCYQECQHLCKVTMYACTGNTQVHKQDTLPQRDTIVLLVNYLKEEV